MYQWRKAPECYKVWQKKFPNLSVRETACYKIQLSANSSTSIPTLQTVNQTR